MTFLLNEWLTVGISTHLLYDDNISWGKEEDNGASIYLKDPDTGIVYTDAAGNPIQQQTTSVQFRENLTVGITYKFGQKTK